MQVASRGPRRNSARLVGEVTALVVGQEVVQEEEEVVAAAVGLVCLQTGPRAGAVGSLQMYKS